jgi:hypothetical protein
LEYLENLVSRFAWAKRLEGRTSPQAPVRAAVATSLRISLNAIFFLQISLVSVRFLAILDLRV